MVRVAFVRGDEFFVLNVYQFCQTQRRSKSQPTTDQFTRPDGEQAPHLIFLEPLHKSAAVIHSQPDL